MGPRLPLPDSPVPQPCACLFQEIDEQIKFRRPYYEAAADATVTTSFKPIEQVLEEVMTLIQGWNLRLTPDE